MDELNLFRFPLAWAAVLLALDVAGRVRHGRGALPRAREYLWAGAASLLFWDLFELLNLRLQDWWYTGVSPLLVPRAAFAAISFATVLPAVRLGEWLLSPSPTDRARPLPARSGSGGRLLLLGLSMLGLALALPDHAFALAWLFLWPLFEAALEFLPPLPGAPSPLQSWRAGDRARVWRLLALGLLLGLLWESLNWRCPRGWVYTVPHFEGAKLFEMPLPGYLGYLPFALEAAAGLALLDRVRQLWSRAAALGALGLLFALHLGLEATAFPLSTLSNAPERSASAGAPLAAVAQLGPRWSERLAAAGFSSVEALARADPAELERALRRAGDAPPPRVLRLWIHAARRELR